MTETSMAETRNLFGLTGYPLEHSFSAGWFNEKFAGEGIDASYVNFPLEDISLIRELVAANPSLRGFNVTYPHKLGIIPHLDSLSVEAAETGAVNCVSVDEAGLLKGHNTDCEGFRYSLSRFIGTERPGALVLGSGGSSRAICLALRRQGIDFRVVSRRPVDGRIGYDELTPELMRRRRLIINTTPLGMFPHTDAAPDIPYELLDESHMLFDLIYNPPVTEFLHRGELRGAHICNGKEMLVRQAELSWEIFRERLR